MISSSTALKNALKQSDALKATARVIAEWNQNRYAGILQVDSTPLESTDGYDLSAFPIETIAKPNRPTRGIVKARSSSGAPTTATTNLREGYTTADYSYKTTSARYYTVSDDAIYKYWCSPDPSNASAGTGKYSFPTTIKPFVLYKTSCWINKIVVTFENSWASPVDFEIQLTTDGGVNWTSISINPSINSKGQVILYRQSGGSWSSTVYRENPTQVNGIRVIVTTINKLGAFLDLIEVSTRLESDLTDFLISYDVENSISDSNFITPLGKASSNTANIVLSNIDGRFNNENNSSLYYGLIDKGVLFTVDVNIDSTSYGGGTTEWIRQVTMYSDSWTGPGVDTITVSLKDYSKFLQEIKIQNQLFENITVGEAVWRICDMAGFVNYVYDKKDTDPATIIPYFWTTIDNTVWDTFQKLAEATQTAIFFDEYGILRIQTRDAAYDLTKTVTWNFDATNSGLNVADIVEADISGDFEANRVDITYKNTKISEDNNGFPQLEVVWQPEDTVALRADPLVATLSSSTGPGGVFSINSTSAALWPYEGIVNIEGEFIKYKGKWYTYYDKNGVIQKKLLNDGDEKINVDKELSSAALSFKNTFNGNINIVERGFANTVAANHPLDINGYLVRYSILGTSTTTNTNFGFIHNKAESSLRLSTNKNFTLNHYYVASHGTSSDSTLYSYGTRIRFPSSGFQHGFAGIAIDLGSNDSGYFVELGRTRYLNGAGRPLNELNFGVKTIDGHIARYGANGGKGQIMTIADEVWYDLEVKFSVGNSGQHLIDIWVNGQNSMQLALTSGRLALGGRFGVYTRGFTIADFEFLYGINTPAEPTVIDSYSFEDKISRGVLSGQWDREYVYSTRTAVRKVKKKSIKYTQAYNQRFFDEFGPYVHEIRDYDVKFEKFPVTHSNIYCSNESQIVCPEYSSTPFNAKFWLANAYRLNAIANGEDTLTFGADNPVDQKLLIYGRLVYQEDEKTISFKDDDAINKRGEVSIEISNDWIQTESMSNAIGNWILQHWAGGTDEVELSIFGNPLIQLGDLVSVNYPAKNMLTSTHKYFVVEVKHSFDGGLETSLLLRRAKV